MNVDFEKWNLMSPVDLKVQQGTHRISCLTCGQAWAWQEVRRLVLLTEKEQKYYEEKISQLTKDDTESYQKCPRCSLLVQRLDLENLCVECLACSEGRGTRYQFCWGCTREWKGPSPRDDCCENKSCRTVALLLSCPEINNPGLTVHQCPLVRACPICKSLVSHTGGCKYVKCGNCANRFCYRCLEKFTVCYHANPNCYHSPSCAKPMAARQTFSSS
ncbi:uncharacterized protein [Heptranchias perlo]|uniref:uncharacterized protein isoform X2 n=1 Tax=Heptranchias perlo TaxID=212740 RepID=UPI0035594341